MQSTPLADFNLHELPWTFKWRFLNVTNITISQAFTSVALRVGSRCEHFGDGSSVLSQVPDPVLTTGGNMVLGIRARYCFTWQLSPTCRDLAPSLFAVDNLSIPLTGKVYTFQQLCSLMTTVYKTKFGQPCTPVAFPTCSKPQVPKNSLMTEPTSLEHN